MTKKKNKEADKKLPEGKQRKKNINLPQPGKPVTRPEKNKPVKEEIPFEEFPYEVPPPGEGMRF